MTIGKSDRTNGFGKMVLQPVQQWTWADALPWGELEN